MTSGGCCCAGTDRAAPTMATIVSTVSSDDVVGLMMVTALAWSIHASGARAFDERHEVAEFERLVEHRECAETAGPLDECRAAMRGHQDDRQLRREPSHRRQHSEIVGIRQIDVEDHDVCPSRRGGDLVEC